MKVRLPMFPRKLFRRNHQNSTLFLDCHQKCLAIVTRISRDHRISASPSRKHRDKSIGKAYGDTEVNDTIFHPHLCQNRSVPSAEWYYI